MRLWLAFVTALMVTVCSALPVWAQSEEGAGAAPKTDASGEASTDAAPSAEAAGAQPAGANGTAEGASPPPAESATEAASAVDGSTYVVRMRDLAQRIDELKEQIRRSHTRLSLLSDTILSGGVGGARAEIKFVNDLSSAFRLTKALFVLDGAVQYNKEDDTGTLAAQKSIPIFSGSVPPGDHTLQVLLKLQGHGYGVFSYLRGYHFEVKSSHSFTVTEGKTIVLEAIAWEKGGVTTPLEDRPSIRYKQTVQSSGAPAAAPKPGTTAASGSISVSGGK